MTRIDVPGDTAAVEIVRTGSRGLSWLEALVEAADVRSLLDAALAPSPDDAGPANPEATGLVDAHPWLGRWTRLTFARCGIVDPGSIKDFCAHGGLRGLYRAVEIGPEATIDEIVASGLRELDGNALSTGERWRALSAAADGLRVIACRAAQHGSARSADAMMLDGDPFGLIEGMMIAGFAVGAAHGFVHLNASEGDAIDRLGQAIETARAAGLLGPRAPGAGFSFDIALRIEGGTTAPSEDTAKSDSRVVLAAVAVIMAEGAERFAAPIEIAGTVEGGCLFGPTPGEIVEDIGGDLLQPEDALDTQSGWPCAAGRLAWGIAQHSERIVNPMIRASITAPWREVSWEAAVSHVAAEFGRIQACHGRHSVGAITASTSTNEEAFLMQKLVRAGLGTNNIDSLARPRDDDAATFPHEFSGYRHVSDEATRRAFEIVWSARLDPVPGLGFGAMLDAALTGSFKGLLVQGESAVLADLEHWAAGLSAMDCVVVQDLFLDETARYAHVFLPAASVIEKDGTVTGADDRIRRIRKVIEPRTGMADWEIIQRLAAAMGYRMTYADPGRILDEIAATTPTFTGVSFAALDMSGAMPWPSLEGLPATTPARTPEQTRLGWGSSARAPGEGAAGQPAPDTRLLLTTGPDSCRLASRPHTRIGRPMRWHEEDCVEMHPLDANERGLRAGDRVDVRSRAGEATLHLEVTERVAPGIVAATFNHPATAARIVPSAFPARDYMVTPVEVSASDATADVKDVYEVWCRASRMELDGS